MEGYPLGFEAVPENPRALLVFQLDGRLDI